MSLGDGLCSPLFIGPCDLRHLRQLLSCTPAGLHTDHISQQPEVPDETSISDFMWIQNGVSKLSEDPLKIFPSFWFLTSKPDKSAWISVICVKKDTYLNLPVKSTCNTDLCADKSSLRETRERARVSIPPLSVSPEAQVCGIAPEPS